jgi:hypothetical protein
MSSRLKGWLRAAKARTIDGLIEAMGDVLRTVRPAKVVLVPPWRLSAMSNALGVGASLSVCLSRNVLIKGTLYCFVCNNFEPNTGFQSICQEFNQKIMPALRFCVKITAMLLLGLYLVSNQTKTFCSEDINAVQKAVFNHLDRNVRGENEY